MIRLPWLSEIPWRLAILDEAQAIKNPDAKQTKAIKRLKARSRIALTGTPIENRLADLWSLFDFINPSYWARPSNSPSSSSGWRTGLITPTARCAIWCGPTSCAG